MRVRDITDEGALDNLVVALCRDFKRRALAIENGGLSRRCLIELRYLNFKILEAAAEIVGEDDAEIYVIEIGAAIGYANSEILDRSEVYYKKCKKLVKENIAKKMHLTD